jgi:ribosomal protein RSM22 (predicted rRNA methylase)
MSGETSLVPLDAPVPFPGFAPLRNDRHEKFAFKRALLMPKAEAYRAAGWTAKNDHAAAGNASRLERRADVAARIAYLRRHGDEQILHAKREGSRNSLDRSLVEYRGAVETAEVENATRRAT